MKSAFAATNAFCDAGADQNALCCYEFSAHPKNLEKQFIYPYDIHTETSFRFYLAQTSLFMVERSLDDGSHARTFKELLEARGARSATRAACVLEQRREVLYPLHDESISTTQYILGEQSGSQLLAILKKRELEDSDAQLYDDIRHFIRDRDNLQDSFLRSYRSGSEDKKGWV